MNEIERAIKSCNEEIRFYKNELKEPYMNQELSAEQDYCKGQSKTHCLCNSKIADFQFIIAALREKAIQDKGCDFCHNERRLTEYLHKGYNNCPICGRKFEK